MRNWAQGRQEKTGSYRYVKRALDLFFSCLLLFFLCLPMLAIALAVGVSSRGGVLFLQKRIGRGGRTFVCYKFRTMRHDAPHDCPSSSFADASRYVTAVGRFLRRTSLDELPQLWNVLRGDMSLVGPRPLIGEEGDIHRMRAEQGVYRVRPGMTGLAQINGRERLSNEEKLSFDVRYIRGLSLKNDVRIVLATLRNLFASDARRDPSA